MVCKRPHCTDCSNREKIQLPVEERPTKRRICHTCSISIENRTCEYVKAKTLELSQFEADQIVQQ